MLILTRKTNEAIHIGDEIVITVCHISDGRVKIGLQAPRDVRIRRGELEKIADDESSATIQKESPDDADHTGPLTHRFSRSRLVIV